MKGHVHNDGGHEMALYIALIHSKVKTSKSWRIFFLKTKKQKYIFLTHPLFSFFVSWILFAIVWFVCLTITIPSSSLHLYRYLISYVHGDFLYYQLQDNDAWVRWQNLWPRLKPHTLMIFVSFSEGNPWWGLQTLCLCDGRGVGIKLSHECGNSTHNWVRLRP